MSRTVIWLLGLIALALLIFLCVRNHASGIQEDILARTSSALADTPTEWVKVGVDGRNVTLTGVAPSEELREKASEMAGAVRGVASVDNQLTVVQTVLEEVIDAQAILEDIVASIIHTPYKTQFAKNASGLVLTGVVPNEEQRRILLQLAEKKFSAGHVTDQLKIKSGAPQSWQQAAELAITNLALFDVGSVSLVDIEISLSGRVANEQTKNEIETALQKRLPDKFKADVNLTVPQQIVEEIHQDTGLFCAEQFNKKLTGHVIHFSTESSGVEKQAQSAFDKILDFAASCPNSIIEVAGYTDSRGNNSYNLWLSRKRAEAIMKKLIKRGMPADRLKAIGHGEANPISGNDSRQGRADNRRIEFNYLQEGE